MSERLVWGIFNNKVTYFLKFNEATIVNLLFYHSPEWITDTFHCQCIKCKNGIMLYFYKKAYKFNSRNISQYVNWENLDNGRKQKRNELRNLGIQNRVWTSDKNISPLVVNYTTVRYYSVVRDGVAVIWFRYLCTVYPHRFYRENNSPKK